MALNISEAEIAKIVQNVLNTMPEQASQPTVPTDWDATQYKGRKLIGVYADMNEAIIAAAAGYKAVRAMSVEQREKIITEVRRLTREEAEVMAVLGVAETGMGRADHKKAKHLLVADKTPGTEDIT